MKVEVRDQGKGMPLGGKRLAKKSRCRMRDRVKQFGGRFEIRSDKRGTTVVATVAVPSSSAQTANQLAS